MSNSKQSKNEFWDIIFCLDKILFKKKKDKYVLKQYVELLDLELLEIFFLPLLQHVVRILIGSLLGIWGWCMQVLNIFNYIFIAIECSYVRIVWLMRLVPLFTQCQHKAQNWFVKLFCWRVFVSGVKLNFLTVNSENE